MSVNQKFFHGILSLFLIIGSIQHQAIAYDHEDAVRAKTGESIELVHPEWGFQDFDASTIYNVTTMTQQAIQNAIDAANASGGGTVIVPEGTINITSGITMKSNVKVQGTLVNGQRATTLNVTAGGYVAVFMCRGGGANMTIENFIINVNNYAVHGINFWNAQINNFLICNNEIHSTPSATDYSAFVLYYEPDNTFFNNNITVKHNYFHDVGMHCTGFRSAKKVLVYSNTFVNNEGGYGVDVSARCHEIEVAGNYIHNGGYGMKAYSSNYVYIHHNDINNVGNCSNCPASYENPPDAIALWVDSSCVSSVDGEVGAPMYMWIENNDLSNNVGRAIDTWRIDYPNFKHLILKNNIVTNSIQAGSNIHVKNAEMVDVYGDNGVVSSENSTIVYHDTYTLSVSSGTGSGNYEEDVEVDIKANTPPSGQKFDKWTGDVAYVANVYDSETTITMPAAAIAVTATYTFTAEPENVALNKAVVDSSGTGDLANPTFELIDGNAASTSYWACSGLQTSPQWIEIDLGNVYSVSSTELICLLDRAYQFTIDVKTTSGGNYTRIVDRSQNTTPGTVSDPITDNFTTTDARYVKITVTGAADYTGDWCSLIEFRLFGTLKSVILPLEASLVKTVTVYPNPTSSTLTIVGQTDSINNARVGVYSFSGKKVYETTQNIVFPYTVDISSLPPDTYIIRILDGDKEETVKFKKQ